MEEKNENQQEEHHPEIGFGWKWHVKTLAIIYGCLLIFYICLRIFLPK